MLWKTTEMIILMKKCCRKTNMWCTVFSPLDLFLKHNFFSKKDLPYKFRLNIPRNVFLLLLLQKRITSFSLKKYCLKKKKPEQFKLTIEIENNAELTFLDIQYNTYNSRTSSCVKLIPTKWLNVESNQKFIHKLS